MSIENRIGSIFEQDDVNIICHQANTWGTLLNRTSSGIASQIEKRYPEAANADKPNQEIGSYTFGYGADGKMVINIYSQVGRVTSYDAIRDVFQRLEKWLASQPETRVVGAPYGYGSNIAIGSWRVVEAIFRSIFEKSPVKLVIVRLPGQKDLE